MTPPQVDHLCWLIADPEATEAALRRRGIGCERGMYYPRAGTQHWNVPLRFPQSLEFMVIANRADAEQGEVGPATLAAEAAGGGLFASAVLVDNLNAVAQRDGLVVDDYTLEQPDGTLRRWRTATGPPHLPFFIDYPNNGNRAQRWQAMYERVGHSSTPSGFRRLTIEGSEAEMKQWLGPNDVPITDGKGHRGMVRAAIHTAEGVVSAPDLLASSSEGGGFRSCSRARG